MTLPRLLTETDRGLGLDLSDHLRIHGQLPVPSSAAAFIDEIGAAGLTGRGGASFPAARKLAAVRATGLGSAVVAGNGAEGEPASRKDVTLLRRAPHLVIDGLQLVASACDARSAVLYVRGGQPDLMRQLDAAITTRSAAGIDRVQVRLVEASPRFLAGEETALVARVSGGAAVPAFKQHRVFERGIAGRPTLVQNVETLAHIALIARHGARWFRRIGTQDEPGSMLCTVYGVQGRATVAEAALGTPLARLVQIDERVQAVLVGGYHGSWLTAAQARPLRLSRASLRLAGALPGAGVLAALPARACGLAETAAVARYLALESAGQCGPCLNGLPRIAAALGVLAAPRPARAELADLRRWSDLVAGRGACHHPDGTVRFAASALQVFSAEIAAHADGRCVAISATRFLPVPAVPAVESDWR